jgi:SAM-dependent methyltransferase
MFHKSEITHPPTWNYKENKMLPQYNSISQSAFDVYQVFGNFKNICMLKNTSVLEVGGVMDNKVIEQEKIRNWISIDKFSKCQDISAIQKVIGLDICQHEISTNQFDYVFSCNAAHHISPLDIFFRKIFSALKSGGIAYLHFGPIWSAPDGHHLDINVNSIVYRFDGISLIPHWYHLLYSAEELYKLLIPQIDSSVATQAVNYIYKSEFLNRNFYEDYISHAQNTGFSILHLSTTNEVDYEYYEPNLNCENFENRINKLKKCYQSNKNFWARDILMILLKP